MNTGFLAVESFERIEERFFETPEHIPYASEHFNVWSPQLATVIVEACSNLDSYWKSLAVQKGHCDAADRVNITNYFDWFGRFCANETAVFFGTTPPVLIRPFERWHGAPAYDHNATLPWWSAYNELKHDRFTNIKSATLQNAVFAVAGLFIGTMRFAAAHEAANDAGMFRVMSKPVDEMQDSLAFAFAIAEGKLFAYPIGWPGGVHPPQVLWINPGASARFTRWCETYAAHANQKTS